MEKKREILEEQIKQALTSTFKVISNHIEDKNSKNKDLKIKTLDFSEIKDLKSKNDYIRLRANTDSKALKLRFSDDGIFIKNTEVTSMGVKPKSYAFCSDTAYSEAIVPIIKSVDALYHESTFLESQESLCIHTKHSTAKQAATIAKKAEVGTLILGHYSSRYKDIRLFKSEAETVFRPVELATDGKVFAI